MKSIEVSWKWPSFNLSLMPYGFYGDEYPIVIIGFICITLYVTLPFKLPYNSNDRREYSELHYGLYVYHEGSPMDLNELCLSIGNRTWSWKIPFVCNEFYEERVYDKNGNLYSRGDTFSKIPIEICETFSHKGFDVYFTMIELEWRKKWWHNDFQISKCCSIQIYENGVQKYEYTLFENDLKELAQQHVLVEESIKKFIDLNL